MLAKLLKYDIKNLGTAMVPMYIFLAVFTVLDRVIHLLQKSDAFRGVKAIEYTAYLSQIFLFSGLGGLFLMLLIAGIHYYKDNMMRDEGYLMHTLPVSAYQLVASKIITFLCYIAVSMVFVYLMLGITFGNLFWYQEVFTDVLGFMSKSRALFLCVNTGVYAFVYLTFCVLLGYLAINIGFTYKGRWRPAVILAVIMLFLIVGKSGEWLVMDFCDRAGYMDMVDTDVVSVETLAIEALQTLFLSVIGLYAVLSVICYTLAGRWLQKRLDLE